MDSIPGSITTENYDFAEEEFQKLILAPDNTNSTTCSNGSSFTALLELPSNQAMELLTDAATSGGSVGGDVVKKHRISAFNSNNEVSINSNQSLSSIPAFPSNRALIERAAKYSVFASEEDGVDGGGCGDDSAELKVKSEPLDSGSNPNSSDPTGGSESEKEKPLKRKEREKKVRFLVDSNNKKGKGTSKKNKTTSDDGEKLPYVHVRARRGQATDSHSLAERARREKINARMKLLQELVPGCNKISGTALVLDEIINHVQYLQRQVEYLSMRLAAVNPRIDFNLDSLISGGAETMMDCSFPNMAMPLMWPENHVNGDRPQFQPQSYLESLSQPVWVKEENHCNLVASENSPVMTYDSPPNSASLHSSQLKMEL